MTGVSSNNPQFQDPTLFANLQNTDAGKVATDTPSTAVDGDMKPENTLKKLGIDLSRSGDANPSDPTLSIPETAPFSVSLSMITNFVNSLTVPDTKKDDDDSFGFDSGGGNTLPVHSSLTMAVPADLQSKDESKVFTALLAYTGIDANAGLDAGQKDALKEQLHAIAAQIATKNADGPIPELASGGFKEIGDYLTSLIPPNSLKADDLAILKDSLVSAATTITAGQFTSPLQSGKKDDVLDALLSFTGVSTDPALSDATRKEFMGKLDELATKIAEQNASGNPDPALSSFDASTLSTYLLSQVDISSMSKVNQAAFTETLNGAADSIGAINAASGIAPPKGPVLEGMVSTNSDVVLKALNEMLKDQPLTANQLADIQVQLPDFATAISIQNGTPNGSGLDITDAATMKEALIALLGSKLDPANPKQLAALNAIATAFASQNTTFYSQLAKSTDPDVVFDALRHLSNIDHNKNLSPAEKQAGLTYLKLMATALAFMSSIRAKITMLEATIRKQENEGKLATIRDQTQAAAEAFKTGITKVGTDLQKALDAIAMKELMAILGPIIIIILAIITAILSIVGCGAVGAALMIAVICVMAVVAIADMQTGMFDKAGKACSKDPAGQKAASFGFQAIIMAIMIVFTLGAASVVCAAQIAAKTATKVMEMVVKMSLSEGLKKALDSLVNQGFKKVVQFVIGEVISLLMSSGLLTEGFVKMFKAMGMSEKDADTAAMVLTIVLMLVMMGAMAKAAGGTAGKMGATVAVKSGEKAAEAAGVGAKSVIKNAAVTLEDEAEELTDKMLKDLAKVTKDSADDAQDALGGAAEVTAGVGSVAAKATAEASDTALENTIKALAKKLASMSEIIKDPDVLLNFLKAIGMLTQVGAGVGKAVGEFNQAKLSEALASLTKSNADTQALIEFLKELVPTFEMTQTDLDNSSKDFMKGYNDLMALFANMVSSASAVVSTTAQTA